jgi:glycosyltransferase involved in cell wall biosynthesis
MESQQTSFPSRRVTVVADEMLGYTRTGGIGTATTFLALALGRMGHHVDFLYVGEPPTAPLEQEWARLYEQSGVLIHLLPRGDDRVEPSLLGRARDTELVLAADPPDVVIVQDLAAPAYTALRMRQLGLGFEHTLFVVYCHGGRRWITDTARKVRVLPGAQAVTVLEQAAVELADVVVSPSEYLLDWMRRQGWRLPATSLVIPYLTRAVATGEPRPRAAANGGRVERIAFFGRLEERKGLEPFAAGLNAIAPDLLGDVELEFVGRETPAWPSERVEALLSERTRRGLRGISFQTNLDQPEALARLSRPGTLAVMPSLGETFSNAVYECLERGIPFIASDAGAPAELVAPDDRTRVLFEPTPQGVAGALRRVLADTDALRPARPAFDPGGAYDRWAEVIARDPERRPSRPELSHVDVVVTRRTSTDRASPCLAALERQTFQRFRAVVAAPEAGLASATGDWVVFLDDEDVLDARFLETLVRAQASSGADVVTCGLRLPSGAERLFLGEPGGLGLLANHYGAAALIRRSLLPDQANGWTAADDREWPLLAGLSVRGARIVSVPRALVTRRVPPGEIENHPADALTVVRQFERQLPRELGALARLAAGLAASRPATPRRNTFRLLRRRIWKL